MSVADWTITSCRYADSGAQAYQATYAPPGAFLGPYVAYGRSAEEAVAGIDNQFVPDDPMRPNGYEIRIGLRTDVSSARGPS